MLNLVYWEFVPWESLFVYLYVLFMGEFAYLFVCIIMGEFAYLPVRIIRINN